MTPTSKSRIFEPVHNISKNNEYTFLMLAAMCACMASPAAASEQWIFTPLPYLPGGAMTTPTGINNSGHVSGTSYGSSERAFIFQDGAIIDLSARSQPAFQSYGKDINDAGQIVGSGFPDGAANAYGPTALLWSDSEVRKLGTLPGGRTSSATAINSIGQVVGFSDTRTRYSSYLETHAVIWNATGIVDLGVLSGGTRSQASAINSNGQVVGHSTFGPYNSDTHATLWHQGKIIDLSLGSPNSSEANDINDAGQIVGQENGQATLWHKSDKINLGRLDGSTRSAAYGINSSAWIVGYSGTTEYSLATLWRDGNAVNLNDLDAVAESGWKIYSATDINDAGQIIGMGINPNGNFYQGFLLSPIPEPTTGSLLFSGMAALFAVAHRTKNIRRTTGSPPKNNTPGNSPPSAIFQAGT